MTIVMLPDAQAHLLDLQDCMLDRWTAGRMICGLPLKRTSLPSWRVWTRA